MDPQLSGPSDVSDATAVTALYRQFLDSWNARDAAAMATLFAEDALLVGFDGSLTRGPDAIASTIGQIFADHETAPYLGIVRDVERLAADCALLHAVVGMPHRGQSTINPAANAIQNLVAVRQNGQWRVALLQTTPAQFHGRPEASQALTEELQKQLDNGGN